MNFFWNSLQISQVNQQSLWVFPPGPHTLRVVQKFSLFYKLFWNKSIEIILKKHAEDEGADRHLHDKGKRDILMRGFNFRLSFRDSCNNVDTKSLLKPLFFFLNDGLSCLCDSAGCPVTYGGFCEKVKPRVSLRAVGPGGFSQGGGNCPAFSPQCSPYGEQKDQPLAPRQSKGKHQSTYAKKWSFRAAMFYHNNTWNTGVILFPKEALFPGLSTSQAGSECGRINLGAQALV